MSKFTEHEVRFLMAGHQIETAARGQTRALTPVAPNLQAIGCPSYIFDRILEDRARKLGSKFTEFRAAQIAPGAAVPGGPIPSLEEAVEASKLF